MQNKKIGILTVHKIVNNGSLLQALATQRALYNLGYNSEIIDYDYPNKFHSDGEKSIGIVVKISRSFKSAILSLIKLLFYRNRISMSKIVSDFVSKNLRLSPKRYKSGEEIRANPPYYDVYVSGSDQIWNPRYMKGDGVYFLDFVKNGAKKISYASSIAVNEIKGAMREIYSERLSTYSAISLREKTGVDLIEKLTGKKASLVCDPTLLLTREEWDSFVSPPTIKIATPYILAYILSYSYNPYPEVFSLLKDLGKKTGLPVVFLSLPPREAFHAFSSTKIASASPSDFINLIKNASYVFTTSFHGSIFSLIYNRPLVCYTNPNDSRLTDLLETMGCANCAVPFGSKSLPPDIQIDFSVVNAQMKKIRKESYSYLKNALE